MVIISNKKIGRNNKHKISIPVNVCAKIIVQKRKLKWFSKRLSFCSMWMTLPPHNEQNTYNFTLISVLHFKYEEHHSYLQRQKIYLMGYNRPIWDIKMDFEFCILALSQNSWTINQILKMDHSFQTSKNGSLISAKRLTWANEARIKNEVTTPCIWY